jgi:ATP-dependent Clp protease adapter protein ClpS
MAFVVSVLQNCVGLSEADATRRMLEIHPKGGDAAAADVFS